MSSFFHQALISVAAPRRMLLHHLIQQRRGWTSEKIQHFQEKRLRDLIGYCWQYVPFYRHHWKDAIRCPEEIQTIADLQQLPLLTKNHVRENLDALTTTDPRIKSTEARTGGSTGRPVIFRITNADEQMCWAQMYVGWSWAGFRPGDPFLVVGGESVGVGLGDKRSLKDWVMNRWVSSGSNVTLERTQALVRSTHFHRLRLIYGYPNSIRELCEFLADLGQRPRSLRGVICTAEVMRPEVRRRIEEVLGVPVLDQYGLNDGGLLACEGPEQDGLHLFFHRAILEILDDEGHQVHDVARPGRAIATLLTNRAMPFVRYETGDRVHWQSFDAASSGTAWARIGPVDGRTGDVLHFPSGRRVPMPGLTLVMRWIDGLISYQFIQTAANAVTVRIDRGPRFTWTEQDLIHYLQNKIGSEVNWRIVWGPPELTLNGKQLIIRNDWMPQAQASSSSSEISARSSRAV